MDNVFGVVVLGVVGRGRERERERENKKGTKSIKEATTFLCFFFNTTVYFSNFNFRLTKLGKLF